jgi:hypothetical protein
MESYANLHGNSGVTEFQIDDSSIKVRFRNSNKIYVYNHLKPGPAHVEKMKMLAKSGRGLSTYISQKIQKDYYSTKLFNKIIIFIPGQDPFSRS